MTALAQRVSKTPMAPYIGVMQSMDINDMNIVIDFLMESVRLAEETKRKADEFVGQHGQLCVGKRKPKRETKIRCESKIMNITYCFSRLCLLCLCLYPEKRQSALYSYHYYVKGELRQITAPIVCLAARLSCLTARLFRL